MIKFANVLKDFKISSLTEPGSRDVFDLVKDFRSIAGEGAMELANSSQDDTKEQFENWELEAKLWHLIELLVNYRTADLDLSKGDDNSQINDRGHTRTLLENNRSLYELWLIMVWIQSNVRVSERPDGMGSSKWSNSVISGSLQSCDLDYPLRNPDCKIDNRDKESDHTFFKYAYNLILAGKFDEVRKECEYTDNLGLALILCGLDSNTDLMEGEAADVKSQNEETIKGKALWRRAVHSLSLNTELDLSLIHICFEIGSGFEGVQLPGSQHNDPFYFDEETKTLRTKTNNSGGIQGGISNGENIYFSVPFKSAATISQEQATATYDGENGILAAKGRHDPSVTPRAVPIVEAMAALVLADAVLIQKSREFAKSSVF